MANGVDSFEARTAFTEGGSWRACFTASISLRSREVVGVGVGECSRGGRGGGGVCISILNIALGGGGKGPAVACTPIEGGG